MAFKRQVIHLVADPFPPYQYLRHSRITGLDYGIVRAAFQSQGADIDVTLLPWEACMKRMDEKLADGIFQIAKTPDRERKFVFSDLLRTAKTVLYSNKKKPVRLGRDQDRYAQLRNFTVGVVRGYSYAPDFDARQDMRRVPVESHEQALLGLASGQFDLNIMDKGVGVYLVEKLRLSNRVQAVDNFEINRPLFAAFQSYRHEVQEMFDRGLAQIRRNRVYDTFMSRYKLQD